MKKRMIEISELFNFKLTKKNYLEIREEQFNRYLNVIQNREKNNLINEVHSEIIIGGMPRNKIKMNLIKENSNWISNNYLIKVYNYLKSQNFNQEYFNGILNDFNKRSIFTWESLSEYKEKRRNLPNKSDYIKILKFHGIKSNKLFSFREEFKLKVESIINGINNILFGKTEYTRINWRFLHHRDIEEERKPYIGLKSSLSDFLIFGAFLILPAKCFALKNNKIKALLLKARDQGSIK